MTIQTWDDLSFWQSDAWKDMQRKLDVYDYREIRISPRRELVFAALDACPASKTRAVLVGQDPYPNPNLATGLAFSIPRRSNKIPATLANIIKEYQDDLHYPPPKHGDLSAWASAGVLLLNAILTVGSKPLSHMGLGWGVLTEEILGVCNERNVPVVLMGGVARETGLRAGLTKSPVLISSHPAPRGVANSRTPFLGIRPFSWINAHLADGGGPINWRIPDVYDTHPGNKPTDGGST